MKKVHSIKRRSSSDYSRLLFLRLSFQLLYTTFSVPSIAGFAQRKFNAGGKYSFLSLSRESQERPYKVRLQRTHRLRDYFAKNGYLVPCDSVGPFSEIQEVELIHEVTKQQSSSSKRKMRNNSANANITTKNRDHEGQTIAFETLPTFEEFLQCYKTRPTAYFNLSRKTTCSKTDVLTRFIARPEFHSPHTTFDIIRQEAKPFNLIWLTDAVFMCSFGFYKKGRMEELTEYMIVISSRQQPKPVHFCVYSLASLASGAEWRGRPPPSELPIDFLWNMLKGTDLKRIKLDWERSNFIPPVVKFVSIIPLSIAHPRCQETPSYDELTDVVFRAKLEAEEINSLLKYCGERNLPVRYEFDQYSGGEHVNKVLRESPHLRHILIPVALLWIKLEEGGAPFTENPHIVSMSVDYSSRGSILRGAARNPGLKYLHIQLSWRDSKAFAGSDSFLLPDILYGAYPLEEMIILFDCFLSIDDVAKILDGCTEPVRTNLRHFSVITNDPEEFDDCAEDSGVELDSSIEPVRTPGYDVVRVDSGEEKQWPMPRFKEAMINKASWDRIIFPRLALNWWYGNYFQKRISGGSDQWALVPWIVQAVNLGIVYRKTTFHTPHDTSSANAGVLFALVRTATLQVD
jgi:hypothetical protein